MLHFKGRKRILNMSIPYLAEVEKRVYTGSRCQRSARILLRQGIAQGCGMKPRSIFKLTTRYSPCHIGTHFLPPTL